MLAVLGLELEVAGESGHGFVVVLCCGYMDHCSIYIYTIVDSDSENFSRFILAKIEDYRTIINKFMT